MQDESKTNEEIQEELDFNKPNYTFIPKGIHEWRQQGYYLVCHSCDLVHATYIGPDRIMVGFDGEKPILKKRKEVGMV